MQEDRVGNGNNHLTANPTRYCGRCGLWANDVAKECENCHGTLTTAFFAIRGKDLTRGQIILIIAIAVLIIVGIGELTLPW